MEFDVRLSWTGNVDWDRESAITAPRDIVLQLQIYCQVAETPVVAPNFPLPLRVVSDYCTRRIWHSSAVNQPLDNISATAKIETVREGVA